MIDYVYNILKDLVGWFACRRGHLRPRAVTVIDGDKEYIMWYECPRCRQAFFIDEKTTDKRASNS